MRYSTLFVLVVAALESGCGAKLPSVKPFKMEIQQGNVVTSKMLLQLRPGMTRSQVRYIMGTPLVVDSFRDNRWDYFYELRKEGVVVEKRRVILDFDKDALLSVRGDVVPAGDPAAAADAPVVAKAKEAESDWTDKLKFWKESEKPAPVQPPAKAAVAAQAALLKAETVAEPVPSPAPVVPETPTAPAVAIEPENTPAVPQAAVAETTASDEVVPLIPEGEYVAPATEAVVNPPVAPVATVAESSAPATAPEPMPEPAMPASHLAESAVSAEPASVPVADPTPDLPVTPAVAAIEPAAFESAAVEPAKAEIVMAEVAKAEVAKAEVPKAEVPKAEVPKVEVPKVEVPKAEVPKAEVPKAEVPKAEVPKAEVATPVVEVPKAAESVAPVAVVKPVVAVASVGKTVALSQGPKPLFKNASAASKSTKPLAKVETKKVEAPVAKLEPAADQVEDDEIVPFIPEGEYVEPVIPTPEDMEKGNLDAEATKPVDAVTKTVTEKGVAPAVAETAAEPVFVQDALPEAVAEPEPELPPPPKVATPIVAAQPEATIADTKAVEIPPAKAVVAAEPAKVAAPVASVETAAKPAVAAVAVASQSASTAEAPAGNASIEYAVLVWADAWRKKEVARYLAAYAPDFVPDGMPSKKAWESQRKQRLSAKQGDITLDIGALDIQRNGNQASVTFNQKYAAKAYHDDLTKTLQLRYHPAQKAWLITRESVQAAPTVSPAVAVAAPVAAVAPMATPEVTQPATTVAEVPAAPVPAPQAAAMPVPAPQAAVPVATPAVEAAVPTAIVADGSIEPVIQAWAQAWRSKNVAAYFAAYASDFVPEGLPSKAAWEAQRKQRLSAKQGQISLELGPLNIQRNGNEATVTFHQKYAAKAYKDEMLKKLQLRYNPAQKTWLIVRETAMVEAGATVSKPPVIQPDSASERLDNLPEQTGF